MSEASAGSDVANMKAKAIKTAGGWLLTGTKMWITNAPYADVFIVYMKTAPDLGNNGITTFIVESGCEGFSVSKKLDKLGMRGSGTAELVFENCFVPDENVMGGVNKGIYVLMGGLNYERLILAAGPLGLMQAAMDTVLPYVTQRVQFKQAIGKFQLVRGKLADMYTLLNASRGYVYSVATVCDSGVAMNKDCASVVLFASESATKLALDAVQLLGGNGYINDFPVGRILRDAKLYEIGGGTNEIRRNIIGKELFKEYSS